MYDIAWSSLLKYCNSQQFAVVTIPKLSEFYNIVFCVFISYLIFVEIVLVKLFTINSISVTHDPLLLTLFHWPSMAFGAQHNASLTWMNEIYRSYCSLLPSNSFVCSREWGIIHLWRERWWEAGIVRSPDAQPQSASESGGHLWTGAAGGMWGRPHTGTHRYYNCTDAKSDAVKKWQWQAALFLELCLKCASFTDVVCVIISNRPYTDVTLVPDTYCCILVNVISVMWTPLFFN